MAMKSVREIQRRRGAEFVENSTYMNGSKSLNEELQKHPEDRAKTMVKFENSILLREAGSLMPLHETAGDEYNQESLAHVVTFNRILQELTGHSLSAEFLARIAKETPEDAKEETEMINTIVENRLGVSVFSSSHTFYPNFPEEVMKKDDAELYFNAAIYYAFGTYGLQLNGVYSAMKEAGIIEEETKRNPLLEVYKTKPKYIELKDIGQEGFLEYMKNTLHGNLMNNARRNDFLEYAHALCKENAVPEVDFFKIVEGPYSSKENEALTAAWLHDHGYDDVVFKNNLCKDAKDILRVISDISLKNGAANGVQAGFYGKDKPIVRPENIRSTKSFDVRLNKQDKIFIKRLMEKDKHLMLNIAQDKDLWKKVMRNIDARKGPEKVVKAFDDLAKDNFGKVMTPNAEIDAVLKEIEKADKLPEIDENISAYRARDYKSDAIKKLVEIARKAPGAYMRRAVEITKKTLDKTAGTDADANTRATNDDIGNLEWATEVAASYATPMVAQTVYNIVSKNDNSGNRITRTKDGVLLVERETEKLTDAQRKVLLDGIRRGAPFRNFSGVKFYIDKKLYDIKAPQRQDVEASNGSPYSRGSVINVDEKKNLIMFGVHWGPYQGEQGRTDIDLHIIAVKDMDALARGKDGDTEDVGFSNLKTSFAVHSGDYTESDPNDDGTGAEEFVVVDKKKLKEAGFRYVVPHINSFNGPFRDNPTVKMVMMQREGSLSSFKVRGQVKNGTQHPVFNGEIYEPSLAQLSIGITATGKDVYPLAYDLEENKMVWLDIEAKGLAISNGTKEWSTQQLDARGRFFNYGPGSDRLQTIGLGYLNAKNSPAPSIGQLAEAVLLNPLDGGEKVDDMSKADVIFVPEPLESSPEGARVFAATDKNLMWDLLCTGEMAKELGQPEPEKNNERDNERDDCGPSYDDDEYMY